MRWFDLGLLERRLVIGNRISRIPGSEVLNEVDFLVFCCYLMCESEVLRSHTLWAPIVELSFNHNLRGAER
jgi:hypothetical protein